MADPDATDSTFRSFMDGGPKSWHQRPAQVVQRPIVRREYVIRVKGEHVIGFGVVGWLLLLLL